MLLQVAPQGQRHVLRIPRVLALPSRCGLHLLGGDGDAALLAA